MATLYQTDQKKNREKKYPTEKKMLTHRRAPRWVLFALVVLLFSEPGRQLENKEANGKGPCLLDYKSSSLCPPFPSHLPRSRFSSPSPPKLTKRRD